MTLLSIQPFSLLCTITPDGSFSLMAVFLLNIIIGGNFLPLAAFRTFVQKQIAEHKIRNDNIINMDEVPLTFDIPMNRTVE
jgi:hypothetical protein